MWENFFSALALVLVFEGILPFLNPDAWRQMMYRMIQLNGRTLRVIGLISMFSGVLLLYVTHSPLK